MHQRLKHALAAPASVLAMILAVSAASAQETQSPAAGAAPETETEEAIVVTGSRIRQIGMESPTPVTAITATDIANMAPSGVIDALDRIPSFLNSVNAGNDATSGVSDAGGTNLNLRGLGTARTLTLLDSRRVVPNNKEGTVNIDIFPSLLVERLDIVTGGASAAYGTDAVAGVVNFLLDTDLDGFRGNAQGGVTSRNDNENYKVEFAYGGDIGERLHVVLSADYSNVDGVPGWEDRDWQQGGALMTNPDRASGGPTFITALDVVGTSFTCGGLISSPTNPAINRLEFLPDGSVQPYVASPVSATGIGTNNAQSLASGPGSGCDPARTRNLDAGPAVSPDREQSHFFGHADFHASDYVRVYAEALYSYDLSNLGPSAATLVSPWNATIFADNAFLPAQVSDAMAAAGTPSFNFQRLLVDLFPDSNTYLRNLTQMYTAGIDATLDTGGFLDGWNVQAYVNYGENEQRVEFFGKEKISTLYAAIDAVRDPSGNIVCRAALLNPAQFGDCVPLNLFGAGNASPAAIDYVTTPREGEADAITFFYILDQFNAEVSMSGEVWEGWGAGAVTAAVGASYREQSLTSFETGLGAMFDTPTNATPGLRGIPTAIAGDPDVHLFDSFADVEGSFNVKEAFGEVRVPLVRDVPLMDDVSLNAAVRWANYSGSGDIWSYKAGLDWSVTEDLRLRGTYSRDVRAATLSERFDVQRTNGAVSNDPVTGQSYNFSQTTGGNPNVEPERADTFTVGMVLRPSWLSGLAVSVDYFSVSISDAINQLGTQNIVVQCFNGAADLCALITRDPNTQLITDLRNIFINVAEEKAEGLDVEISFSTPVSFFGGEESLRVRALGSYLIERSLALPGAAPLVLDGQVATTLSGDYFSYPNFQGTANVNYLNGPFSLLLQGRYISGGKLNNLFVEGVDVDDNDVEGVFYADLGLNYRILERGDRDVELYAFVTNLFDQEPPLAPQPFAALGGSVQTNLQLYDYLGRRFLLGARFSF